MHIVFLALIGTVAICAWLGHERHRGRASRQARLSREFARWDRARVEFSELGAARAGEPA
ncbi:hypothetical protein L3Q65_00135 (plasmid) [Amycolatopsis sp. FU40]|uniref:hypothetical protein n=1 Tax=Amycolatopsis sp. FU40 TaxID=2914159 RepID=UPI001F35FC7F|nr:hypothetical protein [Amycolatopsis sp. FU40]UKD50767.1 hypothetical protein L3Q65_00135 [Amycolatopsis sp. FU40]